MEQKKNYDRLMRELTETLRKENRVPRLLLHACCAPCSSACLERVWQDFEEAARQTIRVNRTHEPDPAVKEIYDRGYEIYRKLYGGLKDLMNA